MEDPLARQRRRLETIDFDSYGLAPEWRGPRWLSSLAVFEDRVQIVGLAHGAPRAGARHVRVESSAALEAGLPREDPAAQAARGLARLDAILARLSQPRRTVEEQQAAWEQALARAEAASVSRLDIPVDGRAAPFALIADGPWWAAAACEPDLNVIVLGFEEDPAAVRLVAVDPQHYREGAEALFADWNG